MTKPRRSLSWRWKLTLLTSMFALAPLLALVYWMLTSIENDNRIQSREALEAVANSKAAAIDGLTANRRRDVERMANMLAPMLEELLAAEVAIAAAEAEEDGGEPEEPKPDLPALQDAEELPEEGEEEGEGDGDGAPSSDTPDPPEAPPAEEEHDPELLEANVALRQAVERRDASMAALRRAIALILWDQAEFEELLVIDVEGAVRIATFAEHEQRDASDIDYFEGGQRRTFVQPVFISPITEQLTMVISTPIRDSSAQVVGVLAARINLSSLFDLLADTTGLGRTGETVVGQVMDDEVVFMAPTRHDPDAALNRRIPLGSELAQPIQEAARGLEGSGEARDYRGEPIIAAWTDVPSLSWGLVVKIDEAEAMEHAKVLQDRAIQIAAVLLVLAVLASFLFARELVSPLARLKDASERISRGDLDVRLDSLRSSDEIGQLVDSFERMIAAIKFFRAHARGEDEDEGLEDEADAAVSDEQSD